MECWLLCAHPGVFDHLYAATGGGLIVDGQMDEWARESPLRSVEENMLTLLVDNTLFWANTVGYNGAGGGGNDVWPFNETVQNCQFVDNVGRVGNAWGHSINANAFDENTGIVGPRFETFRNIEITGPNRGDPEMFELSPIILFGFPGHWQVGDDTYMDILIEDSLFHDLPDMSVHNLILIQNFVDNNCGHWKTTLKNSDIVNVKGNIPAAIHSSSAVTWWSDELELIQMRVRDTGIVSVDESAKTEGSMYLYAFDSIKLFQSSFEGGQAGTGGAISFNGHGTVDIISCLFQGNLAWNLGGAILYKAAGRLSVLNSIFLNNRVEHKKRWDPSQGSWVDSPDASQVPPVEVDVTVRIYTGSTGTSPDCDPATCDEFLPVWKIDGADPLREDGSVPVDLSGKCPGFSSCPVFGNSSYRKDSLYSVTFSTTAGAHRLWHGVVANTPSTFAGWSGDGWIDIVGVMPKVYVIVTDNRAIPDSTGYVRDPDCHQSSKSGGIATDRRQCKEGEAFWSYTEFTVEHGTGGAISTAHDGAIVVSNSVFRNNKAGYGPVLSAVTPQSMIVSNSTFLEPDQDWAPVFSFQGDPPTFGCSTNPCTPGQSCSFVRNSVFCSDCAVNEVSAQGMSCQVCPLGTQPNEDHTSCSVCPTGTYSQIGVCTACPPGKQSLQPVAGLGPSDCEDCDIGLHRSSDTTSCTQCPAGKSPDDAAVSCSLCFQPGTVSTDGIACVGCAAGKEPNQDRTACDTCPGGLQSPDGIACEVCTTSGKVADANGASCVACPAGKTPSANRTTCEPCPIGMAGINGLCTRCPVGQYATSGMPVCSNCPGGMEPTDDKGGCQCLVGTYNGLALGVIECEGYANDNSIAERCMECPPCLDCATRGKTYLRQGWASHGDGTEVFACPYAPACPVRSINESLGGGLNDQWCREGYDAASPICSMCATQPEKYNAYKVGLPCDPCDDGVINIPLLIGLVAGGLAAVAAVFSGAYSWLVDNGMTTDVRILVGLCLLR